MCCIVTKVFAVRRTMPVSQCVNHTVQSISYKPCTFGVLSAFISVVLWIWYRWLWTNEFEVFSLYIFWCHLLLWLLRDCFRLSNSYSTFNCLCFCFCHLLSKCYHNAACAQHQLKCCLLYLVVYTFNLTTYRVQSLCMSCKALLSTLLFSNLQTGVMQNHHLTSVSTPPQVTVA